MLMITLNAKVPYLIDTGHYQNLFSLQYPVINKECIQNNQTIREIDDPIVCQKNEEIIK